MDIGIIGYGSMGRMITEKIASSGKATGGIFVSNRSKEKLRDIPSGVTFCENNRDLASRVGASDTKPGIVFYHRRGPVVLLIVQENHRLCRWFQKALAMSEKSILLW